ncbi:hypothetical protein BIW11_07899, partial [Tropilaelaps mercedesae]
VSADSMPVLPEAECSPGRWSLRNADEDTYKMEPTLNPTVVLESVRISKCLFNEAVNQSSKANNSEESALKLNFVLAHDTKDNQAEKNGDDNMTEEPPEKKAEDGEDTDVIDGSDSSGELTIVQKEVEKECKAEGPKSEGSGQAKGRRPQQKIKKRKNMVNSKDTLNAPSIRYLVAKKRRLEGAMQIKRAEELSTAMENEAVAQRIAMEFSNIRRFRASPSNDVTKSERTSSPEASSAGVGTKADVPSCRMQTSDSARRTPPASLILGPAGSQDPVSSVSLVTQSAFSGSVTCASKAQFALMSTWTPQSYPLSQVHHHIPVTDCPATRPASFVSSPSRSAPHGSPLLETDSSSRENNLDDPTEPAVSTVKRVDSNETTSESLHVEIASPPMIHIPSPLLSVDSLQTTECLGTNPRGNSRQTNAADDTVTPLRNTHTARSRSPVGTPISASVLTYPTSASLSLGLKHLLIENKCALPSSHTPGEPHTDSGNQLAAQEFRASQAHAGPASVQAYRGRQSNDALAIPSRNLSSEFNPKLNAFSVDNLSKSDANNNDSLPTQGQPDTSGNSLSSIDPDVNSILVNKQQSCASDVYSRIASTGQAELNQSTSAKHKRETLLQLHGYSWRKMEALQPRSTTVGVSTCSTLSGTSNLLVPHTACLPLWNEGATCCTLSSTSSNVRVVRQNDFEFAKPHTVPRKVRLSGGANLSAGPNAASVLTPLGSDTPSAQTLPRPSDSATFKGDRPAQTIFYPPCLTSCVPLGQPHSCRKSKSTMIWKHMEAQGGPESMQTIDSAIKSVRARFVGISGSSSAAGASATSGSDSPLSNSNTILGCYLQGQKRSPLRTDATDVRSVPPTGTSSSDTSGYVPSANVVVAYGRTALPKQTITKPTIDSVSDRRSYNLHQLKRVLVTIQKFSTTVSLSVGKAVYHNIYALVSGGSTIGDFVSRVKSAIRLTIRPGIAQFISLQLPHLQKEITVQAASVRMSSSRYMRSNPECLIDPTMEPGDPQEVFALEYEAPSTIHKQAIALAQPPSYALLHSAQSRPPNVAQAGASCPLPSSLATAPLLLGGVHEVVPICGRRTPEVNHPSYSPASSSVVELLEFDSGNSEPSVNSLAHHKPYIDMQNNLMFAQEMLDRVSKIIQTTKKQINEVQQTEQWQLQCQQHKLQHQSNHRRQEQQQQQQVLQGLTNITSFDSTLLDPSTAPESGPISQDSSLQRAARVNDAADAREGTTEGKTASSLATFKNGSNFDANAAASYEVSDLQTTEPGVPERCWNCGRHAAETCSGCKLAKYCGPFCQHRDWEVHHRICLVIAANRPCMASLAAALS